MMGLFINKESLDNNMNLLRKTLKQKIGVINYLQEQLCGNCSLDEDELEENINKLNKVIRIVEDVKYNLDYIDLFDTLPLNQYIIDLNDLKQMYQNKLEIAHDFVIEASKNTSTIFDTLVSIDDQVSWYGDVFGFAGLGESSLNAKDYKSDIDSFNVLNYKKERNIDSFEQARMNYYQELSEGTINRANYYVENNPDILTGTINEALTRINFSTISNIDELTQEHLDLIKTYQPTAYNFIMNLMNGNNDYVEYV